MTQSAKWIALAREAGLAAEHMAIGVTALGRANHAQHAYYSVAFFALSTGLERTAKLVLLVDYALNNRGEFPLEKYFRKDGHNIKKLLGEVDSIAQRRDLIKQNYSLPNDDIHNAIIDILTAFATNITRYYNLDLVAGNSKSPKRDDPMNEWYVRVTLATIEKHYPMKRRQEHEKNAEIMEQLFSDHALVRQHAETGDPISSLYEASTHGAAVEYSIKYVRVYVMQIIRFVSCVLMELGYLSQISQFEDVPYFADFFALFNNEDKYFKQRKTWSIYKL